jgi:hypothetical protein
MVKGLFDNPPGLDRSLRFVRDHFCRQLGHLELRTHLLDLRGLLFQLGCEDLYSLLLLGDCGLQSLNFLVLLEELFEQHRVDLLVVDAREFTILVVPSAKAPTALLSEPLSLWMSAFLPTAVFSLPVVLSNNAAAPTAVLLSALLRTNAAASIPVFELPLVFR